MAPSDGGNVRVGPWALVFLVAWAVTAGCGSDGPRPADSPEAVAALRADSELPAALEEGRALFRRHCQRCHGPAATGTGQGPPLVHRVYHPAHHGDAAFHLAVVQGVRQHHWGFGDMPPVPGVSRREVERIVEYIRHLQREAGIF